MRLLDFKGFFTTTAANFISVENPHSDYYIIKLKPKKALRWMPGEHASFSIPGKEIEGKKWRAFSIASTDEEGVITIGTRTGDKISSFKKSLINMKAGDEVKIRGPFGWFKIMDQTSPIVMIASGVGITPIRALMKHLQSDLNRRVHTVFAAKDYHLFGDELSSIAKENEKMDFVKTSSRDETEKQYRSLANQYGNAAYYYVSGSMVAIKGIKEVLIKEGIKKNRIINDPFLGY